MYSSFKFFQKSLFVAIAMAVLIGGSFNCRSSADANNKQLANQFFKPWANHIVKTSGAPDTMPVYQQFFFRYDNGTFDRAILAYESVPDDQRTPDMAFFYANALSKMGKTAEAADIFSALIEMKASQFDGHARWYLALADLKMGKTADSRQILTAISQEPNNYFYEKAKELLGKMGGE